MNKGGIGIAPTLILVNFYTSCVPGGNTLVLSDGSALLEWQGSSFKEVSDKNGSGQVW